MVFILPTPYLLIGSIGSIVDKILQGGNVWGFAGYIAASVIVGIASVALGYFLVR
jgi:hypothetical protein